MSGKRGKGLGYRQDDVERWSATWARRVDTLEKAYALVQDLDEVKSSKTHDYKASVPRPSLQSSQSRATSSSSQPQTDNKGKGIERSIPKLILRPNVINVRVMDI